MRIGITGGQGFIGSHLCKALREQGHNVSSYDNHEKFEVGSTKLAGNDWKVDLRNQDEMFELFYDLDCVIHLAGKVGNYDTYVDQSMEILKANTLIDQNVLNCVRQNGVKKYIYISSSHVYPASHGCMTEALEPNPDLSYGVAKVIGEHAALASHPNTTVLRLIGIYGPGGYLDDKLGSIIPTLCQRLVEGKRYFIRTTGDETRSFCYVRDAVKAICNVVSNTTLSPGQIFNVGKQEKTSIWNLAVMLRDLVGSKVKIEYEKYVSAKLMTQWCDCRKIKAAIGWEAQTPLEVGLQYTYNDIKRRLESE